MTPQQIADRAFADSRHLTVAATATVDRPRSPDEVARAAAEAVMAQAQRDVDLMEPVMEAMTALIAHALDAQRTRNGRELTVFERDPRRIGLLVRNLSRGSYQDVAAKAAGIAPASIRNWMKAAADGDERYQAVAEVISRAEAVAEVESIGRVRDSGKDPRFWTADMTWAERRAPDRWGKRAADTITAKVQVRIGGVDASQVLVGVQLGSSALPKELASTDEAS